MENNTLSEAPKKKWWWSTASLVTAFLVVGPLALPFLWMNPRYSVLKKVFWTVIVTVLTFYLVKFSVDTFDKILAQYREIGLIK